MEEGEWKDMSIEQAREGRKEGSKEEAIPSPRLLLSRHQVRLVAAGANLCPHTHRTLSLHLINT